MCRWPITRRWVYRWGVSASCGRVTLAEWSLTHRWPVTTTDHCPDHWPLQSTAYCSLWSRCVNTIDKLLTLLCLSPQTVHVAQLSQRDRAAWCVISFGQKWKTRFCRHYRSIFNHCDVIDLQSYIEFGEKKHKMKATTPFKVIQGHRRRYHSSD